MPNYTLPNGTVNTLSELFVYSNEASGSILGNMILFLIFFIILFRNIDIDGFKKRTVFAFIICTLLGLILFTAGVVSGFIFGFFVVGAVLSVLWVGFTG